MVPRTIYRLSLFMLSERSCRTHSRMSTYCENNVFNQCSRVQQAFYSLIAASELPEVHLRIGRVLKNLNLQRMRQSDDTGSDDANIFVNSEYKESSLLVDMQSYKPVPSVDRFSGGKIRVRFTQ
jgi:hypothetical protein